MNVDSHLSFSSPSESYSPAFNEILRYCAQIIDPSPYDLKALLAIYRCLRHRMGQSEKIYVAKILGLMRLNTLHSIESVR